MSDKPSETPRCDAEMRRWVRGVQQGTFIRVEYAQDIERQLTASAAKCAEMERQLARAEQSDRQAFYERQDALQSLELVEAELADKAQKILDVMSERDDAIAGRDMFKATAIEGGELAVRGTAKIRELKARVKELADALRPLITVAEVLDATWGTKGTNQLPRLIENAKAALPKLGEGKAQT